MRTKVIIAVLAACFVSSCGAGATVGDVTVADSISVSGTQIDRVPPAPKAESAQGVYAQVWDSQEAAPSASVRSLLATESLEQANDGITSVEDEAFRPLPELKEPEQEAHDSLLTASIAGLHPAFTHSLPQKVAPFPLVLNQTARRYVDAYVDQIDNLKASFSRSAPYRLEMARLLKSYAVPPDFVYLSFAESAFSKGGSGPWQLTKSTARRFGLIINKYLDERRDPIKSTRAAAEYLATLHDQVGDWRLAVVGWNTGEATIQRFMEQMGADYERMANSLPWRTRALLNRFIAVAFIAHHADEFGISEVSYIAPSAHEWLKVTGGTLLSRVARMAHTTVVTIRSLNPALLRDRVPPGLTSYDLLVPSSGRVTASRF